MAANKYKIGDRVVLADKWGKPHSYLYDHMHGSVVTIDSICERVLEHNERENFYRFASDQSAGHIWDDSDIAGLAPMLPRVKFDLHIGKHVLLLAHDFNQATEPATIIELNDMYFVVQRDWSKREIRFRVSDFVCDDSSEPCRAVVYESEEMMKADQANIYLQRDIQCMFWRQRKVPSADQLQQIVCMINGDGATTGSKLVATVADDNNDKGQRNAGTILNPTPKYRSITPMTVLYRDRKYCFAYDYYAHVSSENPCGVGYGVFLRCEVPGTSYGNWSTIDVVHICTFKHKRCAKSLVTALNKAKKENLAIFDVDQWIQKNVDQDVTPDED